ncbi:hypothetical protein S83_067829 [Arachis hypogaea]
MECEKDVELYRKSIERQRVHIFLAGLDCEFDQIRGDILRKDPIPELEECYSLVHRESVRLATMKGEPEKPEASALVSRNRSTQHKSNPNQLDRTGSNYFKSTASANRSTYRCAHCDQSGHTKSHCFELVGYPDWWNHNRDPRKKNSHKNSTSGVVESKAEQDIEEKGPALIATAGNGGEGSLSLTDTLHLNSVLVVPSLDYNLLSVSQITAALFCVVIFLPEFCVFKDIQTRQTIGCGVKRGNLYYLDIESKSLNQLCQALTMDNNEATKRKSDIWL